MSLSRTSDSRMLFDSLQPVHYTEIKTDAVFEIAVGGLDGAMGILQCQTSANRAEKDD